MRIVITYTDDTASADFEGCGGTWGLYQGTRESVNLWLLAGRSRMEARFADVHDGDIDIEQSLRWVREECPMPALAIMCAEWGAP